ncbi:nucleolar protein [Sporothrix curviconia]|uniref:Nucleolar protein n=1 Tax=Sporothrix curviconia TaxID=1260050 RepID=A0ABP0CKG4_9PEZI
MAKDKKTKATATEVAPRKSSRISEQVVKRKAAEESSPVAVKKRKAPEEPATEKKAKAEKKPAPAKQTRKKAAEPADNEEDKENEVDTVAVEEDATTKALVAEIDGGDDDDNDEAAQGGASLFQRGQDVGQAPAAGVKKAVTAKAAKSKKTTGAAAVTAKATAATAEEKSTEKNGAVVPVAATSTDANGVEFGGVVYVGRIPHGFFEHEMRSYFSQFGDIRRLRLSRNRKTGASKHYAFIEFSDREVADIVAKTMDNYLLFGHLLRCSVVSPDRIPANLFKGANRRFKAVPWNRMAGRKLAQPKPESEWSDKISRETKRRAERAALLESKLGYSFAGPELKTTDTVEAPAAPEGTEGEKDEAEAPKQLEAAAPAEDPVAAISTAPAKGKKGKAKKVAA